MTDPGPFAPPSGALTPRPADAVVPPSPALPPPTGAPIQAPPTALLVPPPPPPRRWLIPVIVGSALVLAGLIAGVVFAATQLAGLIPRTPVAGVPEEEEYRELEDLLEGEPGSPVAVDPLDCVACFDIEVARDLGAPDAVYSDLGLPVGDDSPYEVTAGRDQIDQTKWWNSDGGTPDECFFTYPRAPLFFAPGEVGDATASTDTVFYPEWHSDADEFYYLTEAVRVFDRTASATAYLAELETAIAGCTDYSFPESGWAVAVTPTPALDLPASVAALGWAESNDFSRFYAVDIQRGNLVARLTLTTDAYGPTEAEFRAFAEGYAERLAARAPRA